MEETLHEGGHFLRAVDRICSERAITVRTQFDECAVDSDRREHAVLLENFSTLFETVGRGGTTVGQLRQALDQFCLIGGMNIDIDIRVARHFERIGHFKSVTKPLHRCRPVV